MLKNKAAADKGVGVNLHHKERLPWAGQAGASKPEATPETQTAQNLDFLDFISASPELLETESRSTELHAQPFVFFILEQGLTTWLRLALNLQSCCLSRVLGSTDILHCTGSADFHDSCVPGQHNTEFASTFTQSSLLWIVWAQGDSPVPDRFWDMELPRSCGRCRTPCCQPRTVFFGFQNRPEGAVASLWGNLIPLKVYLGKRGRKE